ncbi:4Fe-4S dicluster domain-containing protein [Roseomonas terrae]|uniref:4Fe-4S dicluster domain-containing protein n=1 Tax=Neoroseomonas terrae TaxID=424799 RepID=A0ABS5EGP6_9PROT|nr:4Fe-4S dicluster domain-containing protein [Neoroseomonas terrae]MBR0650196.1 4Fe-4S dicluster domain-containing protein [Neoroseomonas terrae]
MSASVALAAAGCDGPEEHGHPLHARARGTEQEAASYASVLDLEGLGRGVLVRTRGGHAVKIEGNPQHPASLGATDIFAEAAVLSLHDPERSQRIRHDGAPQMPRQLNAALAAARDALPPDGAGLRLLTGPLASPTLARLIGEVLNLYPGARWHRCDPLADDAALDGSLAAFGRPVAVLPDLARARAVLCLGADPLGPGPAQLRQARDWSVARRNGRAAGALPHLFVAEASPSLTGARADRRIPLHPAEAESFARAVAATLGVPGLASSGSHAAAAGVAEALRSAGQAGLVLAGRGQSPAVHALAHAMNHTLGAAGTALRLTAPPMARPERMTASLAALVADMVAGQVTHLLILGSNPVQEAPAALGFADALRRVGVTLHAGLWFDETAQRCHWHVPLRHPLEAWGDSRAFDGTPAIRQPVTRPLVEVAYEEASLLSALLGTPLTARAAVTATWRDVWGEESFESRWAEALETGTAGGPAPAIAPPLDPGWDRPGRPPSTGLTAIFAPDPGLREDAQNAWLQEMPRPMTGIAWGNAALFDPQTAERLALSPGDEVELILDGRRVLAACWPTPGQAPGCVTLPLGGGRAAAGAVGSERGFDANLLRPADGAWLAGGLEVRPTGRRAALVATAPPHRPDGSGAVPRLRAGEELPPITPQASLHPSWPQPGRAWAMVIDVDACIGCNACAVACQAENNVPVVGPAELARGRGMHWLRIDRHDHPQAPAASFQPVPCMHCEKAPCEPVCPVNATVHDNEGLNVMVHARCIGTRTCSNNCPYKVRRFNWNDHRPSLDTARRNVEVPLRPRGVMEKCTYCSHRISAARSAAAVEGRALRDGEIETACQRACPTQAITFGDLNADDSAVAAQRRDGRSYALLEHLGTRPRTTYLAPVVPGDTT